MGNTSLELVVLDCPDDQVVAVVGILNEHELNINHEPGPPDGPHAELYLNASYTDLTYGDAPRDIADELATEAPGATFICWTEPAESWLGVVVIHAPDLGRFVGDCDANGTPVLTQPELRKAILDAPDGATREQIADHADRAAGAPWVERIEQLRERLEAPENRCSRCRTELDPDGYGDLCSACADRREAVAEEAR